MEVGLEVDVGKTKYKHVSHQHNAGQKICHKFSDNVAMFKHFGITLTNQNCRHEEIKK
jgi:hypothetical protein